MEFQAPAQKKLRKESECNDENSSSSLQESMFIDQASSTEGSKDFPQKSRFQRQESVRLPHNLSNWERKHIEALKFKISFQPDLTPLNLINRHQNKTHPSEEDQLKIHLDLIERSSFTTFLDSLECSSFDELRIEKLNRWIFFLDDKYLFVPQNVPEDLKPWFYSFHCFGKQFGRRLYKTLLKKKVNCPIEESDFQFLFMSFVSAFGMLSALSFAPCLGNQIFTIGDCEVAGVPDIVFSCDSLSFAKATKSGKDKDLVVVVCQVKNDSPQLAEKSCQTLSNKTRHRTNPERSHGAEAVTSSATPPDSDRQMSDLKISDKTIGQHGGELLFNYQNSFRRDTVFGMIVQQTRVSFTALELTHKTFEGIVNGEMEHQQEDRPVLIVTRPYDILNKEDRKQLLEPFIKFGAYQRQY